MEHIDYRELEQYRQRFQRRTSRTEDSIHHNLCCENLKISLKEREHVGDTSIEGWIPLNGPCKDRV